MSSPAVGVHPYFCVFLSLLAFEYIRQLLIRCFNSNSTNCKSHKWYNVYAVNEEPLCSWGMRNAVCGRDAGRPRAACIFVFASHWQPGPRWSLWDCWRVSRRALRACWFNYLPSDGRMAAWQASRFIPDSSGLRNQLYISPQPHRSFIIFHS